MVYKYQSDYDKLSEVCPPTDYTQREINPVYRWLFDRTNPNNFVPQYHRNPKRFLDENDKLKCTAMGLSFFKELNGAKERHRQLCEVSPKIEKTIGKFTSKGFILKEDGVNGDFGQLTHFTHHAFDHEVFSERFEIIQE